MNYKKLIYIGIAVIIFVLIAQMLPVLLIQYTGRWMYNAKFDEYESDFNLIKDYLNQINISDFYLDVSSDPSTGEIRIYSPSSEDYLTLPENIKTSLNKIYTEAFPHKDAKLDVIRFDGACILFCTHNGLYAMVWSPDGNPANINLTNENKGNYTKQVNDSWYHVRKKG